VRRRAWREGGRAADDAIAVGVSFDVRHGGHGFVGASSFVRNGVRVRSR